MMKAIFKLLLISFALFNQKCFGVDDDYAEIFNEFESRLGQQPKVSEEDNFDWTISETEADRDVSALL